MSLKKEVIDLRSSSLTLDSPKGRFDRHGLHREGYGVVPVALLFSERVETYPVYVKLNHINMNRGTLNGLIILEPIVKEDKTKSGILIPDVSGKQKYKSGRVVRVHSGMPVSGVTLSGVNIDQSVADLIKNGIPSKLKEGDVVYYREGRGIDIMVDQKAYVLVPEPHLEMIDI